MKVPARHEAVWQTPLFHQYWRLKDEAPECLLFFRLGDFYELFGDDAVQAAPVLEVQLTTRDRTSATPVPMCGVPAHAVDSYAERLLAQGWRVALAEQQAAVAEGSGKSKIVERRLARILTPGLPVDFGRLDAKSPHWFCSLGVAERGIELLVYDFLGGSLYLGTLESNEALEDLLRRLDPKEILLPSQWLADMRRSSAKGSQWKALEEGSSWSARLTPWAGTRARENLESYLRHTQRCDDEALRDLLPDARDLRFLLGSRSSEFAEMPSNVFEHWAVFPELFDLLDRCGSAVGSRRLKALLSSPLVQPARIRRRQKAFGALSSAPIREAVLARAREVYDLERLLGRFRVGVAPPRELIRLALSLTAALAGLAAPVFLEQDWQSFAHDEGLSDLKTLQEQIGKLSLLLESALCVELDAAKIDTLADLLKAGFDADFDELKNARLGMESWLASYEEELRQQTGISTLKVRYNRVFGHYVEVSKGQVGRVPAEFERKQTTVNGERYTTAVLRQKESEILTAGSRAEAKARELCETLRQTILDHDEALRSLIVHFSWADAVAGLNEAMARLERWGPWTQPEIQEGDFFFELHEARHPILENLLNGSFIANSIELGGPAQRRCLVLTGPNMAGKSTLMRQTGLCLLMAQCGLRVSASSLKLAPCSGFYSRMGATDRILSGESTFMVEMKETASLLRSADAQSFILLDEIGRGTSTEDGLAIAQAVLEFLHEELGALTIFATHYHELAEVAARLPMAENASMGLREWKGDLIFLRTLEKRPASSSYGIFVAKMAGLPRRLIVRSEELFRRRASGGSEEAASAQLGLFGMPSSAQEPVAEASSLVAPSMLSVDPEQEALQQLAERLRALDLDALSPREAWTQLASLRQSLEAP